MPHQQNYLEMGMVGKRFSEAVYIILLELLQNEILQNHKIKMVNKH